MVQAIVLACVYIALPIAVPFATLRPGLLVFFISALFSLKFLTALWALSKFIDERMIDYMYGDTSILVQWGFNDMVLTIITSLSYVGLPIVWLWLMSSFTGQGSRRRKPAVCIQCGKTRLSCTAVCGYCAEYCTEYCYEQIE